MSDAKECPASAPQVEPGTADQLLTLVYDELRRLAAYRMSQEAPGQTLQPTALVHEAWLKIMGTGGRQFENRSHFFAMAGEAMRRILIDRARRRQTRRHGGQCQRVPLEDAGLAAPDDDDQLLVVNDAIEKLADRYPIHAQVVKLRYFVGMTNEETSQALNLSVSTVKSHWVFARAWLFDSIRNS